MFPTDPPDGRMLDSMLRRRFGEAMVLFPVGGQRIGEATVFGSYSLDG